MGETKVKLAEEEFKLDGKFQKDLASAANRRLPSAFHAPPR